MRLAFFMTFWWSCTLVLSAQNSKEVEGLLQEAEHVVFNNPDQALKISNYVLLSHPEFHEKFEASLLMATGFYVKGNYSESLQTLIHIEKEIEAYGNPAIKSRSFGFLTHLFQLHGFEILADRFAKKMEHSLSETDNKLVKNQLLAELNRYKAIDFLKEGNIQNALKRLHRSKFYTNRLKTHPYPTLIPLNLLLGKTHLRNKALDSAEYYLKVTLKKTQGKFSNNYASMLALTELGKLYFLRKENHLAIQTFSQAWKLAQKYNHTPFQKIILNQLASSYLALGNRNEFFLHTQKAASLLEKIQNQKNQILNLAYNFVAETQSRQYESVKKTSLQKTYVLGGVLMLVLIGGSLFLIRGNLREKQYTGLLAYFDNNQKQELKQNHQHTKKGKTQLVPKETENYLLKKLEGFENSDRFLRKDMSLAKLSAQFETNTKYLSEVINFHKNKNFNGYINELRIEYIIKKLKTDPRYSQYKISYLAEESGFSSHSSFATIFKSITGTSPKVFIQFLEKDRKIDPNPKNTPS